MKQLLRFFHFPMRITHVFITRHLRRFNEHSRLIRVSENEKKRMHHTHTFKTKASSHWFDAKAVENQPTPNVCIRVKNMLKKTKLRCYSASVVGVLVIGLTSMRPPARAPERRHLWGFISLSSTPNRGTTGESN